MGGRIHGFLGGTLLTSAVIYYTGEYIKKDQQFISRQLRNSDTIINEGIILGKDSQPIINAPRGTKVINSGIIESSKDVWNEEITKMVNWVYSINWYNLGMRVDEKIGGLNDKVARNIRLNFEGEGEKEKEKS